jgi:hypothetical protein
VTRLSIDFEHASRTWWESGGEDLWAGLTGDPGESHVVVDDDLAASWLEQARHIPGWDDGPAFAPHPVAASPLAEGEEDL